MSILRKRNSFYKKSSSKPIFLTIIVILLALGGIYALGNKSKDNGIDSKTEKLENALKVKSTGLDLSEKVPNIGDVEKVIVKWVESNPEAIIQSVVNMQQKAMEKQLSEAKKNISSKLGDIYDHRSSPAYSPKEYDVALVEFFDYNCGYCKKAQATIEKLIQDDKKVKVIFKEYPILGQSSEDLATVALAVNIVDSEKYSKFHDALMRSNSKTKDDALKIVKSSGINLDKVKKVLESKKSEIKDQIDFNRELGSSIGVTGTPAFVIGNELVSGAVELQVLKDKIADERANKNK